MKKNVELDDKVRSQELEIASLKQELETANTGVNKKIADIRSLNRSNEPRSPFGSPFGSNSFGTRVDDDYNDDNGF